MKKPMHPENDSATTFTCSMHPEVVTDQPGRCPTCGMELIRVKEDSHE
ncbi:MAG: heavy metal-binding domain-containing protein [Phycisphaerae bacterium]